MNSPDYPSAYGVAHTLARLLLDSLERGDVIEGREIGLYRVLLNEANELVNP